MNHTLEFTVSRDMRAVIAGVSLKIRCARARVLEEPNNVYVWCDCGNLYSRMDYRNKSEYGENEE